jgi:hypothetical protein
VTAECLGKAVTGVYACWTCHDRTLLRAGVATLKTLYAPDPTAKYILLHDGGLVSVPHVMGMMILGQ